jgi:hypothetical protein
LLFVFFCKIYRHLLLSILPTCIFKYPNPLSNTYFGLSNFFFYMLFPICTTFYSYHFSFIFTLNKKISLLNPLHSQYVLRLSLFINRMLSHSLFPFWIYWNKVELDHFSSSFSSLPLQTTQTQKAQKIPLTLKFNLVEKKKIAIKIQ